MPVKIKKTISAITVFGNSVRLNGSSQYLTIPASSNWAFGTGSFTVEWFQYMTSQTSYPRVFAVGNYPSTSIGVSIEGGTFYVWEAGTYRFSYSLTSDGYLNRWIHFAVSRDNGTTRVFKNGAQIGSSYSDTNNITNSSTVLCIGQESSPGAGAYFDGYISNFRILKGTGLYTASFAVPNTTLTAITNTTLLTCQSSTIIDNSIYTASITNSGGATVSSTITPFSSSAGLGGTKIKNINNIARVSSPIKIKKL
jgi:hypothetical protein